jgi:hypothetical protein
MNFTNGDVILRRERGEYLLLAKESRDQNKRSKLLC